MRIDNLVGNSSSPEPTVTARLFDPEPTATARLFNPEPTATAWLGKREHRTFNIELQTSIERNGRLKSELRTKKLRMLRRGYTVLELTIALGVFAVLLVTVAQSVALVAQQRRISERRELAMQTADNVMEAVFARPWDELIPERLAGVKLAANVQRELPSASLKIAVTGEAGPPAARRIRVEVGWSDSAGPVAPAQVTAWRYEP